MQYDIITKNSEQSLKVKKALMLLLEGKFNEKEPDVVFSVGGDGTVLEAVRKHIQRIDEIVVVAIHTGNLGFYTQFLPEDIHQIKEAIKENKYITYPLLKFEVDGKKDYALNEITISSGHKLLRGTIKIDEEPFMDVVANGICISTPSGSTAYNKSLGGAIMDPTLNAIQMTLIAPFQTAQTTMISPFIISDNHKMNVFPLNNHIEITFDREVLVLENVKKICVRTSDKKVKFLKMEHQPFIRRVREKFVLKK